jgi:hypothetical protein
MCSTLAKEMKNILTNGLLFLILLFPVLSAQDVVIRADDPFLPKVIDNALKLEEDKKAQAAIPKEFLGIEGANIQFVAKKDQTITYRLNNNSDNPISFGCSGINNPSKAIEVLKDGRWQPPENFMICGTGLYLATLAPKKSILFEARIWDSGTQMKVGIQIMAPADAKGDRTAVTVWSPPTKTGG